MKRALFSSLKKILLLVSGIVLVLLGIVGLFVPVLQGILLIAAGLGILATVNDTVKGFLKGIKGRYFPDGIGFKRLRKKILSRRSQPGKPKTGV